VRACPAQSWLIDSCVTGQAAILWMPTAWLEQVKEASHFGNPPYVGMETVSEHIHVSENIKFDNYYIESSEGLQKCKTTFLALLSITRYSWRLFSPSFYFRCRYRIALAHVYVGPIIPCVILDGSEFISHLARYSPFKINSLWLFYIEFTTYLDIRYAT
jgi:hypothetical protein